MNNEATGAGLLRMIGFMGISVGVVWALQILGFGEAGTAVTRMTWVLAAATIAGAGAGLIVLSTSLPSASAARA